MPSSQDTRSRADILTEIDAAEAFEGTKTKVTDSSDDNLKQARLSARNLLGRLSIRSKLLLMLLASTLATIGVFGYMANKAGKDALTRVFFERLQSIRNSKAQKIQDYFRKERDAFGIFGNDISIVAAINSFNQGLEQLSKSGPLDNSQVTAVEKYYETEFLPRAAKRNKSRLLSEQFVPATALAQKLQYQYIANNPFNVGEKARLKSPGDSNLYNLIHETYHPFFEAMSEKLGLYDVFLINADGRIIYSVAKETDFGTDLQRGAYRDTGLGRLYRSVMKEKKKGDVLIEDFSFYPPSYYQAAAFVAVPVYSDWKFVGVLAGQLSVERLNAVMSNSFDWENNGLGKTGEAFLVGEDFLMRSDSRQRYENQDKYLASLKAILTPQETRDAIEVRRSSILLQRVGSEQVKLALEGKRGTKRVESYQGNAVLSAYTPLDIPGLNWALITEISEDEALHDQRTMARNMLLVGSLLSILTTIFAILAAWRFLAPVQELIRGISQLKSGDENAHVRKFSDDEFGELTDAFNGMADEIRDRNTVIRNKSRGYEALLRSIFPDAVADRLKSGESQIVENISDASIVYLTLHGFSAATENKSGEEAVALLNELVEMIDLEAEKYGVEKVKTVGDHYLAACGLSTPRLDHVERILKFIEMVFDELTLFNQQKNLSLTIRAGVASGSLRAGIVGQRRFVYDVWGRPANVARRIVYAASVNSVRITKDIHDQLHEPEEFSNPLSVETQSFGTIETMEMHLNEQQRMSVSTSLADTKKSATTNTRDRTVATAEGAASPTKRSKPRRKDR